MHRQHHGVCILLASPRLQSSVEHSVFITISNDTLQTTTLNTVNILAKEEKFASDLQLSVAGTFQENRADLDQRGGGVFPASGHSFKKPGVSSSSITLFHSPLCTHPLHHLTAPLPPSTLDLPSHSLPS